MNSLPWHQRIAWTFPLVLALPFLAGANGGGCESTGNTAPDGTSASSGNTAADGGTSASSGGTNGPSCGGGHSVPADPLEFATPDASPAYDGGYPTGVSCTTSADCPDHGECGYVASQGCAATSGTCFPPYTGVLCDSATQGCGCHGGGVAIPNCQPLPPGYVLQPYASTAACPASTCTKDADCGSGEICGFREADACGAVGVCVEAQTGVAICDSATTGCGCDGSEVFVPNCTELPNGYLPQPIKHRGACEAGTL
jgi:hypothetical protein